MSTRHLVLGSVVVPLVLALACSEEEDGETRALLDVKAYIDAELDALSQAALDLSAAAPEPDADGWSPTDDAADVDAMKAAWRRARQSYERIEGAIAILFPQYDRSTDERYDRFIEEGPDANLFDGEGVTGVHGIERILWADAHPPTVVAFESALPNYTAARFPETEEEARQFRDELVGRLVDDAERMRSEFAPLALDPQAAFHGVIGSMREQLEKVRLAATGEDESRYAEFTLGDMRSNLEGGRAVYSAFGPWLHEQPEGAMLEATVVAGFDRLDARYSALPGDAIPTVPATWDPSAPSTMDLATPYGMLFVLLEDETDAESPASLVRAMNAAADALGIPRL